MNLLLKVVSDVKHDSAYHLIKYLRTNGEINFPSVTEGSANKI